MTKHDLLAYLADVGEAEAATVADAFGLPYPTCAMALLRLVRQGLAGRALDPDRQSYAYWLSHQGYARLTFFERELDEDEPHDGEDAEEEDDEEGDAEDEAAADEEADTR